MIKNPTFYSCISWFFSCYVQCGHCSFGGTVQFNFRFVVRDSSQKCNVLWRFDAQHKKVAYLRNFAHGS